MKKLLFLFLVFFALAFAHMEESRGPSEGLKANVMHMQYDKSACRIDYYVDSLEHLKTQNINVSVDEVLSSLNSHKSALETAASDSDRKAFNDALKLIKNDIKDVHNIYSNLRESLRGRNNTELRKSLRDFLAGEKTKRNDCIAESSVDLGEAQSAYVKAWISQAKNMSAHLKEKGLDTSSVDSVISDAEKKTTDLDTAIATGDGEKVHEAVKSIREEHLHIWARFHIARLQLLVSAVEKKASEKGLTADVSEIKSLLDSASSKAQAGVVYKEGEFKEVRKLIKEAHSKLKELVKNLRGESKEMRKAERENNESGEKSEKEPEEENESEE